MITREDFTTLDLNKFEHTKKYCQLLSSKPEDLMMCKESNSYSSLINKSIKMGTLNLKYNGKFFDVVFRNISGNPFAFYPGMQLIIIGNRSLDRLL